jgi:hypothetical protein
MAQSPSGDGSRLQSDFSPLPPALAGGGRHNPSSVSRLQPGLLSLPPALAGGIGAITDLSSRLQPGFSMMALALARLSMAEAGSRSPAEAGSKNIIDFRQPPAKAGGRPKQAG